MSPVGVIVNPWAGKDVRRLHAPVGHTPDTAKVGIVRRIVLGALAAGAERVLVADDAGRIGDRAIAGIDSTQLIDGPGTGSALDTRRAATQLVDLGCRPLVVLGGDGTCRDVAIGAPGSTLIAVSTGTNNVFPVFVDGSSAGYAAGLVANEQVAFDQVGRPAKRLDVAVHLADGTSFDDVALVDVALIDGDQLGARAVLRAGSIRCVVAAIASPASTGLSAVVGRAHPISRHTPGAVRVMCGGSRRLQVPIVPGSFDEVAVESAEHLDDGASVTVDGPGVLAFDGERQHVLRSGDTATITVSGTGPMVIDVDRVMHCAAKHRLFDVNSKESADGS